MSEQPFHPAGDKHCPSCWRGYPKPCHRPLCKGLIHAVFGGRDDNQVWLHAGCDVCDLRENVIPSYEDSDAEEVAR